MVGQVIGNEAKAIGNFRRFKEVPPLTAVTTSRVLQQDRNAGTGFFKVNTVLRSGQFELYVTTARGAKRARGL